MKLFHKCDWRVQDRRAYATGGDFCHVFADHTDELYRLSLLLTRDPATAERCLLAALDSCIGSVTVFSDCALAWAKRALIQSAIALLQPRPDHSTSCACPSMYDRENPVMSDGNASHFIGVLALNDFERVVFVTCVLERYSVHECSLLLGCASRQVLEGRARAIEQLCKESDATRVATLAAASQGVSR